MISLFTTSFQELSASSGKSSLISGLGGLIGLILKGISSSSAGGICSGTVSIYLLSFSSPGSASSSTIPFYFLFLVPFVTPVRVRGDALGHVSSLSHDPLTPATVHSLLIVAG